MRHCGKQRGKCTFVFAYGLQKNVIATLNISGSAPLTIHNSGRHARGHTNVKSRNFSLLALTHG